MHSTDNHTRNRHRAKIALAGLILGAGLSLPLALCVAAPPEPLTFDELDALIGPSNLIVQGHVMSLNQGLRETEVTFQVERIFKGDPTLKTVTITHRGGKHVVVQTEPEFMSYDRAILFLQQRGDGRYVCTGGIQGKKTVRNDNVYISSDNSFLTARLNVYQDAISARLRAQEGQIQGSAGQSK